MDYHCDLLFLLFKDLVLLEVLSILGFELFKHFTLLQLSLVNFHELLDSVELIMHGNSVVHHLLFALAYDL